MSGLSNDSIVVNHGLADQCSYQDVTSSSTLCDMLKKVRNIPYFQIQTTLPYNFILTVVTFVTNYLLNALLLFEEKSHKVSSMSLLCHSR